MESLAPFYRMIVFTAAAKMYAEFVVNRIDPKHKFIEKIYHREHCK